MTATLPRCPQGKDNGWGTHNCYHQINYYVYLRDGHVDIITWNLISLQTKNLQRKN